MMSADSSNEAVLHQRMYETMRLIRRSQDLLMEEYHPADEMRCPVHFCVGQEASPAALSLLFRPGDIVMSHHRSHGYYLAKGAPLDALVAELYGRKSGANGGQVGSQELSCADANFFSGAIMAGMFSMATGAGFAQKYRGTDDFTLAVIGDGAMEEGIVFEVLNLASLQNLPILFLCENNLYSAYARTDRSAHFRNIVDRVAPFNVETHLFDGNDPLKLSNALSDIVAGIRAGRGPVFVEVETYRICGHVGPENDDYLGYRTREELESWSNRDPLAALRATLLAEGFAEDQLAAIESRIDDQVLAAIAKARKAAFPSFEVSVGYNASGEYAPAAAALPRELPSIFDGAQNDTKLAPY